MERRRNHDGSRRTFRGRGGPRDGNLPKKKHHPRERKKKEGGDSSFGADCYAHGGIGGEGGVVGEEEGSEEPVRGGEGPASPPSGGEDEDEECKSPQEREEEERLRRLMLKIRNVRTMVRQSSGSLRASSDQWRTNCLNPAQNCVTSWRSIVRSRPLVTDGHNNTGDEGGVGTEGDGEVDDDEVEGGAWCKEPSLAVFELMQSAMQSGPLSGGKPGYFKRCGSEVASMALSFLRDCSGTTEHEVDNVDGGGYDGGDGSVTDGEARLRRELRFTERQALAVCRWLRDAEKAAGGGGGERKPPSKSVMKQQKKQQGILNEKREVRSKKAAKAKARARRERSSDLDDDSGYSD